MPVFKRLLSARLLVAAGLLLASTTLLYSQGVFVPVYNSVYPFLERMSLKGVTDYSKLVLPKTRLEIARTLRQIRNASSRLSTVEGEQLEWFEREFDRELRTLQRGDRQGSPISSQLPSSPKRWHLASYDDSSFAIYGSPILGGQALRIYDEFQMRRWMGLAVYASLGNSWGFQTDSRDNVESGDRLDRSRIYTMDHGIQTIGGSGNEIQYSETKGAITFESDPFIVSAGKEWFNWGSGFRSQLILSDKAPSFPFLRLDVAPVPWLKFYYLHGFLNSRVPDSSRSYTTQLLDHPRTFERPKYYAAHGLEFVPTPGLSILVGESVVYSDDGPRIGYLIPVLFFRLVDHYYEGGEMGKGSNSQLFVDVNYKTSKGLNLYSTLFIDEIDTDNMFSRDKARNQLGFTVGVSSYGLGIADLGVRIEYTRILPWVYSNFIQTQTYTSSNYLLGHYIGQNADQLFIQIDRHVTRALEIAFWAEQIRQGGFDNIGLQYDVANPPKAFLYGLRRTEQSFGVIANLELTFDLNATVSYQYSKISDEDPERTPSYQQGTKHSLGVRLSYGL